MLVLELLAFVALSASVVPGVAVQTPHKRTYDTHKYYTLELSAESTSSHANSIIKSIGAELVEPLGELPGHWLVRVPGITPHESTTLSSLQSRSADTVLERWSALRKRTRRSGKSDHQLRSLTPLSLRKRTKRGDPPPPSLRRSRIPHLSQPMVSDEETLYRRDDTELLMAQDSLGIADPMLNLQWHLINQELKDIELNVTGSWAKGITGKGVKVAIIDDGLDVNSDDLHDNFFAEGSWDYNDHTELPLPRLSDDQHGTRCAGEIGAVKNDVCGVGVAYESNIAGVRILSAPISDADEAAALNYAYQLNDIYSCSWGPPDDGKSMEAPDGLILKAMVNGVQKGRGGKGSVFVFAAGNGGGMEDQCNFDGYTNSIFSVTVGAVDRKGLHPYYSELCSAMMFVAPSSGSGDHIHTTDVGKNKCAHSHGGTSAAAPLAAGVFALVLQARPDLSWRDLQHLAVRSSIFFNPDDPDWETTKAGRKFSYKYGYGRIDAYGIVEMSRDWKLVKPQAWFDSPAIRLPDDPDAVAVSGRQVPGVPQGGEPQSDEEQQGDDEAQGNGDDGVETNPPPVVKPSGTTITPEGIRSSFEVTEEMLKDSNFETLEHITVRVWIEHQRRGDVEVEIVSPNGIRSVLARIRRFDEADTGFPGWKFMSLKHWEENPLGTWTITVKDTVNPNKTGRFVAWSLQLWGECIDAAEAKLWAPAEEGAPDEEEIGSDPTVTQSQKPKPTDHLPDDHGEAEGEAHKPGLGGTTDVPAPTPGTDITEGEGDADGDNNSSDADSGYFDGIKSLAGNPMWMAGAGLIVVLAGAATGLIFIVRARKRRNNLFGLSNNGEGARGAYAPVSEDVPMGLLERGRRKLGGGGGAAGTGGSKDLYDAFGDGPSDDDDNASDGSNERTALRYHDDFLDDDGEDGAGKRSPVYKDEPDTPTKESGSGGLGESASGASSSSWQDAAEDVPPRI